MSIRALPVDGRLTEAEVISVPSSSTRPLPWISAQHSVKLLPAWFSAVKVSGTETLSNGRYEAAGVPSASAKRDTRRSVGSEPLRVTFRCWSVLRSTLKSVVLFAPR